MVRLDDAEQAIVEEMAAKTNIASAIWGRVALVAMAREFRASGVIGIPLRFTRGDYVQPEFADRLAAEDATVKPSQWEAEFKKMAKDAQSALKKPKH